MTPLREIVFDYADAPTIKRFSEDRHFIRGLMGPFGSGKSSGCVMELVKIAAAQHKQADGKKRSRFAVIRNTYPQLRDTTVRTFHDWLPPMYFGQWKSSEHIYIIDRLDPEIEMEVWFRALDKPEHVANLLSAEFTAAWVNEAREVPYAVIKALMGRVGRYPSLRDGGAVRAGIIMDTNPPDDESWWYDLFEVRRPENAALFRQPGGRSPAAENVRNLPPDYYSNMISDGDEDFIRVYVDGEYGYVKEGKPVYPEYVDSVHCQEIEPLPGVTIYRGWDFGLTPACVFSQVLPDGRFLTFDELTADTISIDEFAETVLEHSARYGRVDWVDVGDPAGGAQTAANKDLKSCFDVLHGHKIMIEPGEQALPIRLGSVKKALNTLIAGKPRFIIHPRCKLLRKGFQGRYQYKRIKVAGAEEKYQDKPDKNAYSHPHDALQYTAARLFGGSLRTPDRLTRSSDRYDQHKRRNRTWMSG
jgi:hypothetical protein